MTTMLSPREKLARRYPLAKELVETGQAPPQTAEAVRLLLDGVLPLDIGEALGVSRSRGYELLRDPLHERADERRSRVFGRCKDCGGKTFNGGSYDLPDRCVPCRVKYVHAKATAGHIEAVHDWVRRYGTVPSAMDWNMPFAEMKAHPERLAQIRAAHKDREWPAVSTVQQVFGSWNALIEAAGLETLAPGKRRDPETHKRHLKGRKNMKPVEVIKRALERNEKQCREYENRISELKSEREQLRNALAALNGKVAA